MGGRCVGSNNIHPNIKSLNASEHRVGSAGISCLEEVLRYGKGLSKVHTSYMVTGLKISTTSLPIEVKFTSK